MRIPLTIFFFFLIINVFSHQDTFYKYKYGNVSAIIQTGYLNEQVNNVKIIGQYADLLCQKLNYSGDIFLFFGHDYIPDDESENQTYMSVRNDSIYQILGFRSHGVEDSLRHPMLVNDKEKIVIQQFDISFNIKTTLELLNFGISNFDFINQNLQNCYALGYDILTIDEQVIDSVKSFNSMIVSDILSNRVNITPVENHELEMNYHVSYFSQYGNYILIDNNEKIIDTIKSILQLNFKRDYIVDYVVVLESKEEVNIYTDRFINPYGSLDSKVYLKSKFNNPNLINIEEGISDLRLIILDNDVLYFEFLNWYGGYTDMKYIFLAREDKLITDFVEYLNDKKFQK